MIEKFSEEEVNKAFSNMPYVEFENDYGEKFKLEWGLITIYLSGDEVNTMVYDAKKVYGRIKLFNDNFDVWGVEELKSLGESLIELSNKIKESK